MRPGGRAVRSQCRRYRAPVIRIFGPLDDAIRQCQLLRGSDSELTFLPNETATSVHWITCAVCGGEGASLPNLRLSPVREKPWFKTNCQICYIRFSNPPPKKDLGRSNAGLLTAMDGDNGVALTAVDGNELPEELWAPHSADGFFGGGGRDIGFFGGGRSLQGNPELVDLADTLGFVELQGRLNLRGGRALRGPEAADRNEGAIVILAFGGCALLCPSNFCRTPE